MSDGGTLQPDYFDKLYRANPDPWSFETSLYEREKYSATLGILSRSRYAKALEIGCSIGVFTSFLSARCDRLLAIDGSRLALDVAKKRDGLCHVSFERRHVPDEFPPGQFNLIILSEVLYYLDAPDLELLANRCLKGLTQDGEIVACHWLGETDYPSSGSAASDRFAAHILSRLPFRRIANDEVYRLERFLPAQGAATIE